MYKLSDISVIIPTYNRADDLRTTLHSFRDDIKKLREVIIVDQSKDDKTERIIRKGGSKLKYIHTDIASLTAARNLGIENLSSDAKIVLFLDDDVSLDKRYFDSILEVFNTHERAMGASGYYLPPESKMGKIESALRRIFLIEHKATNSAAVLSAYGAVYPCLLTKIISAQWLSGFNMAYKAEVFKKIKFDENLFSYSLGEDFDFSYRVYLEYPESLYLTPEAKLVHRVSNVERVPTRKISYMNQINHFYFNFKNFNRNAKEKIAFAWTVVGITLLRTINFVSKPNYNDGLRLKFYFESLAYCLKNLRNIRQGDLSIPENAGF